MFRIIIIIIIIAQELIAAAQDAIETMLDAILGTGLTPSLALCMKALASVLPRLKPRIQDGLLQLLSHILMGEGGPGGSPQGGDQRLGAVTLALRTLAGARWEDTGEATSFGGTS